MSVAFVLAGVVYLIVREIVPLLSSYAKERQCSFIDRYMGGLYSQLIIILSKNSQSLKTLIQAKVPV